MDLLLNKEVRNLLFDSLKNKTPRWEIIESLIENFESAIAANSRKNSRICRYS